VSTSVMSTLTQPPEERPGWQRTAWSTGDADASRHGRHGFDGDAQHALVEVRDERSSRFVEEPQADVAAGARPVACAHPTARTSQPKTFCR